VKARFERLNSYRAQQLVYDRKQSTVRLHCAASVLYPPFLHYPALLSKGGKVARIRSNL